VSSLITKPGTAYNQVIVACIYSLLAMEQISLMLPDFRNKKCYLGTESKHVLFTLFVMISNIPRIQGWGQRIKEECNNEGKKMMSPLC
jgi:hypothetical protein